MVIDILYSKSTGKVYCIKDSYYYKNKFQVNQRDVDYIQISSNYLNRLIAKNPAVSEWSIIDILEIKNY